MDGHNKLRHMDGHDKLPPPLIQDASQPSRQTKPSKTTKYNAAPTEAVPPS